MTGSIASLCLSDLAQPRQSVFGRGHSDTVAEIADLPKLDAHAFFAETHITEGMGVLLRQVFDRLMGRSDQGVFRLKQAMGGGKTHNLLAAALLAREPTYRKAVLQRVSVGADDRIIRVAAFSGRETDTSEFLWVTVFRALGCEHRWERSNEVPGPSTWARVIGEEPALILLDELPPFFVSLGARVAGPSTTEADRLTRAGKPDERDRQRPIADHLPRHQRSCRRMGRGQPADSTSHRQRKPGGGPRRVGHHTGSSRQHRTLLDPSQPLVRRGDR
jgi:hypothetical protein